MTTMQAVVMTATGGPEVLELREIALPWPRDAGDVLVRLKAAGLNPADTFFRALGTYVISEGPCVLGHDGAGIVEQVGAEVTGFRPGARVCFCNGGVGGDPGTYAAFAVVPEAQLARIPDQIGFHEAATFPLVAITAWESLYDRAGLASGEYALIHGGAGGTGQMAIQLARLRGARVATTVSTDAKADPVKGLGAERPILYRAEDFVTAADAWTEGRGLDVALDNVGTEAMLRTFRSMAPYGRVVTLMGTPADDEDLSAYNRNLTIHNVMMLTPMWFGLKDHLARQGEILRRAIPHLGRGEIATTVEATYPLAEAAAAQARLEAGGMSGKIVLAIDG